MHGIIYLQLKKFLTTVTDTDKVKTIYQDAGVQGKFYDATKHYPDEELVSILNSACKHLNLDREIALNEFGKFMTPGLITTYKGYIKPEWKCLDLLENIENTMHKAVRASNPGAEPPRLVVTRVSPGEVRIDYTSPRKMISLGEGIIAKIAEHFNEGISIVKSTIPNGTRLTVKKQ